MPARTVLSHAGHAGYGAMDPRHDAHRPEVADGWIGIDIAAPAPALHQKEQHDDTSRFGAGTAPRSSSARCRVIAGSRVMLWANYRQNGNGEPTVSVPAPVDK